MTRTLLQFPWLAVLTSVAFSLLLVVESAPDIAGYLNASLLFWLHDYEHKLIVAALVVCVLIFDILRFRRAGRAYDARISNLNEQINELFKSKSALQNKAHKYSGHADKLKYFISDRLLEYIEYDEKFLHFKSIASEVRHNGVICFDQVGSLLKQRLSQELPAQDRQQYQDALDSMVYLWDLLDLSTTDNIAMYVANKLYECEELLYHQLLDKVEQGASFRPVFPARRAAVRAVRDLVEDGQRISAEPLNAGESFCYQDEQFMVWLDDAGDLLGNENYVRLIVENMLNNGLYYATQRQYKNRYARLSLRVSKKRVWRCSRPTILDLISRLMFVTRFISWGIRQSAVPAIRVKGLDCISSSSSSTVMREVLILKTYATSRMPTWFVSSVNPVSSLTELSKPR